MRDADDEDLALAAGAGDHLAFAELYRRYVTVLAKYIHQRLGGDTADVLQDTFAAIHRGLEGYRGPSFFSWAYRICVNAVTNELRKKLRQGRVAASMRGEDRGPATPEEELVAQRLSAKLERALHELPTAQKTVFLLARVKGLSYAEIGDLLGVPEGTVKSRMFKAVKALFPRGDVT